METNKEYLARLLPLLKKPIPSQWRVQSFSKKKAQATVMSYIDQRDLMDVLDEYCEYGWQKKYEEVSGNLFCYIGINMPDGTVHWRSDCGVESQADKEKGQASDAAKRAGVNWGVGRFLYEMGVEYVTASAIKTNDNWPHCIDEQGKQIWDLDKYVNDRLSKQGKGVIPPASAEAPPSKPALPWLNKSDAPSFAKVVEAMKGGYTIEQIRTKWSVSKATEKELEDEVNKPA